MEVLTLSGLFIDGGWWCQASNEDGPAYLASSDGPAGQRRRQPGSGGETTKDLGDVVIVHGVIQVVEKQSVAQALLVAFHMRRKIRNNVMSLTFRSKPL
jgi:hypothetical protein